MADAKIERWICALNAALRAEGLTRSDRRAIKNLLGCIENAQMMGLDALDEEAKLARRLDVAGKIAEVLSKSYSLVLLIANWFRDQGQS